MKDCGRTELERERGRMRLSGRVRIRAESGCGWQDCQWRPRSPGCPSGLGTRQRQGAVTLSARVLALMFFFVVYHGADALFMPEFGVPRVGSDCCSRTPPRCRVRSALANQSNGNDSSSENDFEMEPIGEGMDTGPEFLSDLTWRVEKLRLEEQNKKRFLKAGPRFLRYDDCRKWVQAWGNRWQSQEEWNDWIYMGEKRNAYIPVRSMVCVGD